MRYQSERRCSCARALGAVLLLLVVRQPAVFGQDTSADEPTAGLSRVRTGDAALSALLSEAFAYSPTFRQLVTTIERSDGLVYLLEGPCPERTRACLLMQLEQAGPNRMLRIHIPPGKADVDAAGSIAHELQHAVEVLADRRIRTTDDLFALCHMIGPDPPSSWLQSRTRRRFETAAAQKAGEEVREEFRRNRSQLRMMVRVDDKAGVQGAWLDRARKRAGEVFAMSGVYVDWIDGADAIRLNIITPFTILIMAEAPARLKAEAERLGVDVMGQGAPVAGRAYIYYDRIVAFRPAPPRDLPTTLGDVIAHELGHLILPPGHSPTGIMQPTITMTSRRVETFTRVEASEIQSRLRTHPVANVLSKAGP